MKRTALILIHLLTLLPLSYAFGGDRLIQNIDGTTIWTTKIESIINRLMDVAHVTGLGLAIINNDTIVYERAYGFRNTRTKEPLDTSDILYGASLSKAVFAYLCMHLVEKGILDLDTPLYRYLPKPVPDYPKYSDLARDDRWKLITARMCLSHTTGFPNWRFLDAHTGYYVPNGRLAIYFTPGTRYGYSGEGMMLLQLVVETITGKGLEELAKEYVFQPSGMWRSSYIWQPRFENNYALGYDEQEKPLTKHKRSEAGAAGSLETTIADYARFVQFVMRHSDLKQETFDEMITPQILINSQHQFPTITDDTTSENQSIALSYGLGWGLITTPYGKAFFKEGHDDGWEHYNINFIDKDISIVIMTNSSNGESIFKKVLEEIIGDRFTPWKWERYIPYNYSNRE